MFLKNIWKILKVFEYWKSEIKTAVRNWFIDFALFYFRNGFPLLFGDQDNQGAFDKVLIFGVENSYKLMLKKLVQILSILDLTLFRRCLFGATLEWGGGVMGKKAPPP